MLDKLKNYEYEWLDYHLTELRKQGVDWKIVRELNCPDKLVDVDNNIEYDINSGLYKLKDTLTVWNYISYPANMLGDIYRSYQERLNIFIWDINLSQPIIESYEVMSDRDRKYICNF